MGAATITVLYPTGSDSTFNMDYYMSTHMPLVQKNWGDSGLKGWKVTKLAEPTDTKSPYSVQATLDFASLADFQKSVDASGPTVLGDVPNFSNKDPVIIPGEVVGTS